MKYVLSLNTTKYAVEKIQCQQQSCQVEMSDAGDLPPTVCQKREKYMQDAKRLAQGCEATDNARKVRGHAPPQKKNGN